MTERERIAKTLTRPITPLERNRYHQDTNAIVEVDEIIRLREALLELAESFDILKDEVRVIHHSPVRGLDGHGPGYD